MLTRIQMMRQMLKDQKYNYLIAKNEVFFLVWNGSNQNANFIKEVYEEIVQKAKNNNLKTPYHVYAHLYLCQADTANFYQIPDSMI